ncbi:hypothetical protein [Mycobacterium aquaticum]|uniref:PE-PPE domain-containing protein n=1 Tax=Mycobacterium aquaticum TaxID=1927124 RepID=A0A1W9ZWX1_9MYCO|nr:hypothetical protein [Mycobacterium aquaticum]ORA22253.1 hypothetical protein BST13_36610 [Mycobacterium aquaticum]
MTVSVRSYLIAGAAAATATTIALTPVQVTPADIAVPAHPTSTQPQLTQAMVELLAAASRMTAAVPAPPKPAPIPGSGPTTGAAPALATPSAVVTPQNAASDFVTSAYQFIQYWVNYGVDVAQWALGWVPYGYLIGDQVGIIYDNLVRPISDTVVYNLINPVLNAPLNLGVWANGIADVAWSVVASAINTGIAEANYFLGWILPPLPPLPLPPLPFAATAQTTSLAATTPTQTLSTTLAGVGETLANAFKGLTEGTSLLNVADVKAKPATDVTDTTSAGGELKNPVQTVVTDIETAASGATDVVKDAVENVTDALPSPSTTTQTDAAATVPKSVQQSLQSQKPATADTSVGTSRQTRINDVRDGVRNATADLKATVQKATDGLRNAVKGAGKTTADSKTTADTKTSADTKTKVSKTDKPSKDNSGNSGSE